MKKEKLFSRDLTFSQWHRNSFPDDYAAFDIDLAFMRPIGTCEKPIALIETAKDVGQSYKSTTWLRQLAKAASIEAWLFLWYAKPRLPERRSGKDRRNTFQPIEKFRIKQVAPFGSSLKPYTEEEARLLVKSIRERHSCPFCKAIAAR